MSSLKSNKQIDNTVEKVIKNESIRYQEKGFGLISAFAALICFYYIIPKLIKTAWPFLLENLSQEEMYFYLGILFHTGSHVITNGIMGIIYKIKLPFFEKYRVSDKPWPWESQPELWKKILRKTLKVLAIEHFVIVPIILLVQCKLGIKMRFDLESFPSLKEIIGQIIFFAIVEDFFFYWTHRILHHPKLYPYIHKIHHEYNITISLAAEYAHPLEFIFGNLFPVNVGPRMLGNKVHVATYLIWIIVAQMETADQHSGYEFPWSPYRFMPLSVSTHYHNFHHSHNAGNFCSVTTVWDTLCGTNKSYFTYLAKKREKAKLKK